MKPSDRIHTVAEQIKAWASADAQIRAMFWFGSYSVDSAKRASDLDCALLLNPAADAGALIVALREALGPAYRFQAGDPDGAKVSLWIGDGLMKLDIVLARAPEDLAWLADAPDVPAPRLVQVFDHDRACASLLRRAQDPAALGIGSRVNLEIEKFLVGFEACSAAHRKSDAYSHYFEYNLALGRLARLVQLARGEPERLYLPVKLTSSCLSLEEQEHFLSLAGTMRLGDANATKRRLTEFFLEILDELGEQYALERDPDTIRAFLEQVLARDLLWNVRDWSEWTEGWIKPGVIIRASCLTRWQSDPALETWLKKTGVSTIIDLRSSEEVADRPYHAPWLGRIAYQHVPLAAKGRTGVAFPMAAVIARGSLYAEQAQASLPQVVSILRTIAKASGGTVVHCHVGVDRTGWVLALLGLAIGIPVAVLADDYLASEMHSVEGAIEQFAEVLGGQDGVTRLLTEAGLADDELIQLRNQIMATCRTDSGRSAMNR